MSEELLKRARELLALRDKATPGPWHTESNRDEHYIGHRRTKIGMRVVATVETGFDEPAESEQKGSVAFLASAHDMADTIRDLMAEVERLKDGLSAQVAATNGVSAYAVKQANRADAAESRLRELASEEPVMGVVLRDGQPTLVSNKHLIVDGDAFLIRRPEMPS